MYSGDECYDDEITSGPIRRSGPYWDVDRWIFEAEGDDDD